MPPEGVNPVELPASAVHVWQWFLRLSNKRPQAMAGICAIPESEIGWFFRNRSITPEVWVLDAIDRLDSIARNANEKEE